MRSRRELMKLLGLAPVVVSSATAELAGLMASPTVAVASTLLGGGAQSIGHPLHPGQTTLGMELWKKIEDLRGDACRELDGRQAMRLNGLDPDIAALKATSFSYKAQKQFERDMEQMSFMAAVNRKLWPV